MSSKGLSLVVLFAQSLLVAGCVAATSDPGGEQEDTSARSRPIISGTKATAYPEAVLVDLKQNGQLQAYCSGSLIAPQVVLTAGHCVYQFNGWTVTAPFANGQKATSTSGATYDWTNTSESVNPNMHDIGLVFLSKPITLSSYPSLATSKAASNAQIINIGRIHSGTLSTTALYQGAPVGITLATSSGFPYDYVATDIIESGDSGGPDELVGTHEIVAVNSGAGGGTEVLARVDLVASWIQQQIAAHGGSGTTGTGSSGSTGTGTGGSTGTGTGGSTGSGSNACSHSICASGGALTASCDPCATEICSADSYCCSTAWDSQCEGEVQSICGQNTCSSSSSTGSSGSTGSGSGTSSACGNVTFAGECVGNTVEWCDGTLQKLKCGTSGTCGFNSQQGYYDCL